MTEKRKQRALHFVVDYSGFALCGKVADRIRYTSRVNTWCNPLYADGRRCPECQNALEARGKHVAY